MQPVAQQRHHQHDQQTFEQRHGPGVFDHAVKFVQYKSYDQHIEQINQPKRRYEVSKLLIHLRTPHSNCLTATNSTCNLFGLLH